MIKQLLVASAFFAVLGCFPNAGKQPNMLLDNPNRQFRLFAHAVQDSFTVFVHLPQKDSATQKLPVVYLLDANLYFDILVAALDKYAEVGLAPRVILVGIGYTDFATMDSLRNRDYTSPVAKPDYEMPISGGAAQFLSFITGELIPHIDTEFETDTSRRVVMGHSLGGYFALYALSEALAGKHDCFSGYIAASPSMEYNDYYLLNQLKKLDRSKGGRQKRKAYLTFGGLEDAENAGEPGLLSNQEVLSQVTGLLPPEFEYKGDIYSNFSHMDTALPTFLKGLPRILGVYE